ncbi:uncharacterized protein LOC114828622 [Galendromus occidentalis]|uniref:Uncharacterized protein LOC114828622 n=1 Tax=Galendromus occidentalis TaxID=34638 RepID=A0AAJ7SIK9_9ACAR|nr:uncharacterized protein LOC114828622 [Galendromus occidentalis]
MEEIEALRSQAKEIECLNRGPDCVVDALEYYPIWVISIFAVFALAAVVIIPYTFCATDDDDLAKRKIEVFRRASALELDLEGGPLNTSVSGFTHASPISELTHHFHMKNFLHIDSFKQYARRLSHVAHLDFSTHSEPSSSCGKR